ncbi:MAG: RNA pseudouridine synthase [Flavobacteriales bacterium]|nr:RNA pseudouridine synthase [Flavobacteriales bacterium]|tara:strand:- start:832 stop:1497 length:666 start_codon:yes stop_codon:yes gene_type:complete
MLEILYEDNHLIAINKKNGILVQGDKTGDQPLLEIVKEYIKKKYNKPGNVFLGTIHRLDRPTSGVLLFAKTSKALARMNLQFSNREVNKTYLAIVEKKPPAEQGKLKNFLKKNEKNNKSFITKDGGKKAILEYKLFKKFKNYFLLKIKPQTGRHHQIRVQLANIKCNIKGDVKYGAHRTNKNGGIDLHAWKIKFTHPIKKTSMQLIAPYPANPFFNNKIFV